MDDTRGEWETTRRNVTAQKRNLLFFVIIHFRYVASLTHPHTQTEECVFYVNITCIQHKVISHYFDPSGTSRAFLLPRFFRSFQQPPSSTYFLVSYAYALLFLIRFLFFLFYCCLTILVPQVSEKWCLVFHHQNE